jgi:hypothetical protein
METLMRIYVRGCKKLLDRLQAIQYIDSFPLLLSLSYRNCFTVNVQIKKNR